MALRYNDWATTFDEEASISVSHSPRLLAWALLFVFVAGEHAYAYTDPGSGMLLWQGLMATLVGAGFYFRKAFFRLLPRKKTEESEKQTGA
ncbi:MAG: hypothetical protein ACRD24_05990 [Terriglobales bacterium]